MKRPANSPSGCCGENHTSTRWVLINADCEEVLYVVSGGRSGDRRDKQAWDAESSQAIRDHPDLHAVELHLDHISYMLVKSKDHQSAKLARAREERKDINRDVIRTSILHPGTPSPARSLLTWLVTFGMICPFYDRAVINASRASDSRGSPPHSKRTKASVREKELGKGSKTVSPVREDGNLQSV